MDPETITIGRITYRIDWSDRDDMSTMVQLASLHGPRGDYAMVVRDKLGARKGLVILGSKTLDHIPRADLQAALAPVFGDKN